MRTANLEPVARAVAERIARQPLADGSQMPEAEVNAWVDRHWECAAAELATGLIGEDGRPVPGRTAERSLAAWREWKRGG